MLNSKLFTALLNVFRKKRSGTGWSQAQEVPAGGNGGSHADRSPTPAPLPVATPAAAADSTQLPPDVPPMDPGRKLVHAYADVRIGDPLRRGGLTVFPLFMPPTATVKYILSDEAIRQGVLSVEEISQAGSVPELLVINRGAEKVLFIEGEELVGAKQNRILNTSVLVGADTQLKIPVSCVERGRWQYKSKQFGSAGTHSPSKLRHALKESVAHSIGSGAGYCSDQGRIWEEVDKQHIALGVASHTRAQSDSFAAHRERIRQVLEELPFPDGASGMAIGIGSRLVAIDVFDQSETLRRVWNRLLTGFVLETLDQDDDSGEVPHSSVEGLFAMLRGSLWKSVQAVGEGEDFRTQIGNSFGSILAVDGVLVHGSVLVKA